MQVAAFGTKVFSGSVNRTLVPESMDGSLELKRQVQDNVSGKPSTYIKGAGLRQLNFVIKLKRVLGVDVAAEIKSFESMLEDAKPLPLTIGGVKEGNNNFLLVNVSKSKIKMLGTTLISAEVSLTFEEFYKKGSAKDPSSNGMNFNLDNVISDKFHYVDKLDEKRSNPNAEAALKNGPMTRSML